MEGQLNLFDIGKSPLRLKKKIRLIELFGGIGCQAKALENIGANLEHYRLVEIDKYAVKSYNALHGTSFEPMDITKVHAEDLNIADSVTFDYIMTYSYPCFTADTLVLTSDGYKNISDVQKDDEVLCHDNKYHRVTESKKTGDKPTYTIKTSVADHLECTENHKFYVRKMSRHYSTLPNGKRAKARRFGEPQWVETRNLDKTYYIGTAINQNAIVPSWNGVDFEWSDGRKTRHKNQLSAMMDNRDFWWLIGCYVGDGWIRKQGGIIICGNEEKVKRITEHLNKCGFNYCVTDERTAKKIQIPLIELSEFVKAFGYKAHGKKIPGFVFDMPKDLLGAFLDGYMSADGHFDGKRFTASSVSRELIYGIGQIVAKVYERPYGILKTKRRATCVIEGRTCNQRDGYTVSWKPTTDKQDKAFYENGYIWCPIHSVTETTDVKAVYDITVEDAHSFTANGVIAHNCTSLSVAGKMEGMEEGSGTASSLLWEVKRILEEINNDSRYDLPQVLLMENVPQVHSRNNIDDFKKWLSFLDSLGYTTVWQDLNARDYGIAQNRMRTFAVSFLGNHKFDFPKPIPLTKVMLDYCDMYVDEKYFFKGEKVDEIIRQYREEHKAEQNRTEQNRTISLSTNYSEISVANCIRTKDRGIQRRRYADNGVLVCNKLQY